MFSFTTPSLSVVHVLSILSVIFFLRAAYWVIYTLLIAPAVDPLRLLPGPDAGFWDQHILHLVECVAEVY